MDKRETEDLYLRAIFMLQRDTGETRSVDIASSVMRTKATVSYTVKQLKSRGYVQINDAGRIQLTESGADRAAFVYESYQLLKELLMKAGADEQMAEENACRMERVISPDAVDVIRTYLRASL